MVTYRERNIKRCFSVCSSDMHLDRICGADPGEDTPRCQAKPVSPTPLLKPPKDPRLQREPLSPGLTKSNVTEDSATIAKTLGQDRVNKRIGIPLAGETPSQILSATLVWPQRQSSLKKRHILPRQTGDLTDQGHKHGQQRYHAMRPECSEFHREACRAVTCRTEVHSGGVWLV